MSEKIRCTKCRGGKQVMKLGGIYGKCLHCDKDGLINQCDKPAPVKEIEIINVNEITKAVDEIAPVLTQTKDNQQAIFKRQYNKKSK